MNRPIKKVIKPLNPEEQQSKNIITSNDLELSTVIFRVKRNAEVEPSDSLNIDQMSVPNVYKKPQHTYIRESEGSHNEFYQQEEAKNTKERIPSIAEELGRNNENNYKLVLKKINPASIYEDEEAFRKGYKTYYNDEINKLKREDILKQKRKALLLVDDSSKNIEILDMSLKEKNNQLDLVGCMEIEKDKHLKEELEKEDYDCYLLERVPENEVQDAPKVIFNDLTKAVIENHLNKRIPDVIENNDDHPGSAEINKIPNLPLSDNNSHLLRTNFNAAAQNQQGEPVRPQVLESHVHNPNEGLYKAPPSSANYSQLKNVYSNFYDQEEEEEKHDNYYAPSIDQLSSQHKIEQPSQDELSSEGKSQRGVRGIFFILQIAFIMYSLKSIKIGYFSFPLVPGCLGMLGIGILLVLFGHKSNRIILFLAIYSWYIIWLVLFFKNMRLLVFAAALVAGAALGLIGVSIMVVFKKRLADLTGFICGNLASMLFLMSKKKYSTLKSLDSLIVAGFLGGIFGVLLVRFINKRKRVVFSTTLLGVFLMNISLNVLANNYFVWDYNLKLSKSHVWIFVFGILRQIDFSGIAKRMRIRSR